MKPLTWLMPIIFCISFPAVSQELDPVYGLGICTSGTYHTNQRLTLQSSTRSLVPAVSDSSCHVFPDKFEEGLNGFVNGDAREWNQFVSRSADVKVIDVGVPAKRAGKGRSALRLSSLVCVRRR